MVEDVRLDEDCEFCKGLKKDFYIYVIVFGDKLFEWIKAVIHVCGLSSRVKIAFISERNDLKGK